MSMLVNPFRHLAAAEGDFLEGLFANGEIGDYWRFDADNTDANAVSDPITVATGLINGRLLEDVTANTPALTSVSGHQAAHFDEVGVGGGTLLVHALGSTVTQPGTIILCMGDDQNTNAHVHITGSAAGSRWQLSCDSSDNVIAFAGATLDSTLNKSTAKRLLTVEFNGASTKFRSNGTQVATGNAGTQGTNQITIGALYDDTFGSTFDAYSLLFINRLLTAGELDTAERLLGSHAGLSW